MKTSNPNDLSRASFFWALRQLECSHASSARLGETLQLAEDWIRLRQAPHLSSLSDAIERYEPAQGATPAEMRVRFMGLFGPQGALPLHLTELAAERAHSGRDESLWRFIDLFHHRMLTLFYRAWAVHQPTVDFDRPAEARFARQVGAMVGLAGVASEGDSSPAAVRLFYSGQLARPVRNAEGLEQMLSHFFGVPARVLPFIGHWLALPPASHCALGRSPGTGELGRTAFTGERVWDCQTKFRVRLGPLRLDGLRRFLPGSTAGARLREIVCFYVGLEFAWDVQCILRADEVPATQLGSDSRLGWTTWLKTQPFTEDAGDLVLGFDAP